MTPLPERVERRAQQSRWASQQRGRTRSSSYGVGEAPASCEHAFVTSQGSAYSRFQRAVATGNMRLIEAAATELPKIGLDDALAILIVLAQTNDPRFDRAAARWVGRLLTETPAGLSDARFALALVERLPGCRDALHGLARQR